MCQVITVEENADRVVVPRFITDVSDGSLDELMNDMTFQVHLLLLSYSHA